MERHSSSDSDSSSSSTPGGSGGRGSTFEFPASGRSGGSSSSGGFGTSNGSGKKPVQLFDDAPVFRSLAVAPPQLGRFDGPKLFDAGGFGAPGMPHGMGPPHLTKAAPKSKVEATPESPLAAAPSAPGKIPEITSLDMDFITPGTYTTVNGCAAAVRKAVEKSLYRQSITFSSKKNESKCTYASAMGASVVFYLVYFTRKGETLLECRRWSGDAVIFNRIKKVVFEAAINPNGEGDHAVVELEPKMTLPLHVQAVDEKKAKAAFDGVMQICASRDTAKHEDMETAIDFLTKNGGRFGGDILSSSEYVNVLVCCGHGIIALANMVAELPFDEKHVDALRSAVPKLVGLVRDCDKDCHSAFLAVHILHELLKKKPEVAMELDPLVFESARDFGSRKYSKLAESAISILVEIECCM